MARRRTVRRLDAHFWKRAASRSASSRHQHMGTQCGEVELSPRPSTEEPDARIRGKRGEREVHRLHGGCRRKNGRSGLTRNYQGKDSLVLDSPDVDAQAIKTSDPFRSTFTLKK